MAKAFLPKKAKYGQDRVELDGRSFASKLEAALYSQCKLEEKAGIIRIDKVQDHVYLTEARILYIPDFRIVDLKSGKAVWREAKGFETERWLVIKKLWKHYGPGPLQIYKGSYNRFKLAEEIIPA